MILPRIFWLVFQPVDSEHNLCWRVAGVSAVGVALVASAAKAMAYKLCAGPLLASIATATVAISYYWPKAYTFPCLIIAGGLITLFWELYKKVPLPPLKVVTSLVVGP